MTTLDYVNTDTGEVNIELFSKTKAGLAELEKLYGKVPEINTEEDYEFVKNACKELTGTRTAIEAKRKEIKEPYLEAGRRIDAVAKEITESITKLEAPMKAAKKEHDDREKRQKEERLARIRQKIDAIAANAQKARGKSAAEIEEIIEEVHNIDAFEDFYELKDDAIQVRDKTLTELQQLYSSQLEFERNERKRKEAEAELAEQQRKQQIEERLNTLRNIPMSMFNASLADLNKKIEALQKHKPKEDDFAERHQESVKAWEQVIDQLKQMVPMAEHREQQQREAEAKANEEAAAQSVEQKPEEETQQEYTGVDTASGKDETVVHQVSKDDQPQVEFVTLNCQLPSDCYEAAKQMLEVKFSAKF